MFTFDPLPPTERRVDGYATEAEIATEPMLFSASIEFARAQGGLLTSRALEEAVKLVPRRAGYYQVIDTRCHMLMPGMVPAIPGWHCDTVPRPHGQQPDLAQAHGGINVHATVTIATPDLEGARTEFVGEKIAMGPALIDKNRVWGSVDREVNALSNLHTVQVDHGVLAAFSETVLHRATAATHRGWRFFFRLSNMRTPPKNQIRRQTQVYFEGGQGW